MTVDDGGPIRTGTVRRPDGAQLAWEMRGAPGAPAVLLLPGQANSASWWSRRLQRPLLRALRTITFDPRGTGRSTVVPDDGSPWTTVTFADDAAAVLDAVGVSRAGVYGTSMGGRVAQQLAARHPDRVSRMVLACTSPGGPRAVERDVAVRRRLADPDPRRRRAALVDLFYTPAGAAVLGAASTLLGDPTMTPAAQLAHLRASNSHDAWDDVPDVQAPTLVLHGTDDEMVPVANAGLLAERLPRVVVEVTVGGRHGFFDEFVDDVAPRVVAWLTGSAHT